MRELRKKLRKFLARNNLEYQVLVVAAIAYLFWLHTTTCF